MFAKSKARKGDEKEALAKGQSISAKPNANGKFEITDHCPYCLKEDKAFNEPAVMENHIKNLCKMTTKCPYCNDLVETPELKDHWLLHCKKGPHIQCQRCKEVFP